MSFELCGTGLNALCAIGKLHFYDPSAVYQKKLKKSTKAIDIPAELSKLEIAVVRAGEKIEEIYNSEADRAELLEKIYFKAKEEIFRGCDASYSVENAAEVLFYELAHGNDPYVSSGSAVVSELAEILLSLISEEGDRTEKKPLGAVILIAKNMKIKELEALDRAMLLGIMLTDASPLSDIAGYAFTFGIPLIVGCNDIPSSHELEGVSAVIDSEKGVILTEPESDVIERYALRLGELASKRLSREKRSNQLKRFALINFESDLDSFTASAADCIGILNIEKLLRDRAISDVDRLFSFFLSFSRSMCGKELRLLLPRNKATRSLVLSAMLRAAEYGNISLLLPAVSSTEIRELRCELLSSELGASENIAVGALIEGSAAILNCDEIAGVSDFITVDCDSLFLSLMFPMRANDIWKKEICENADCLVKAFEIAAAACRKRGIRAGAHGSLVLNKKLQEHMVSLGFSEIYLPSAYIFL